MKQLSGLDNSFLLMEVGGRARSRRVLRDVRRVGSRAGRVLRGAAQDHRRAAPHAAALSAQAGLCPLRTRPALLGRGRRLRSRLSRPAYRRPAARRSGPASRAHRPHSRPSSRPRPPALGGLCDRRTRRRSGGLLLEDPPRHDRRGLGLTDDGTTARHPAVARARRRYAPELGGGRDAHPSGDAAARRRRRGHASRPHGAHRLSNRARRLGEQRACSARSRGAWAPTGFPSRAPTSDVAAPKSTPRASRRRQRPGCPGTAR